MKPKPVLGFFLAVSLLGITSWWLTNAKSLAPNAVFTTLQGDKLALANLRGRPVLVTFWATDCPGCIEEIPHLISLHNQFQASGLQIIAVAMPYDPPSHVLTMVNEKKIPYAVALDIDSRHVQAFGDIQLTPTTFLIDRQGVVVSHHIGALDYDF